MKQKKTMIKTKNQMMKRKNDIVAKLTGGIGGLFAANKVTPIAGRG